MQNPILYGGIAVALIAGFFVGKMSGGDTSEVTSVEVTPLAMVGDARRGKSLFVSEGCVICHSVQGVGGRAAPGLDAVEWSRQEGAYDFAARMWAGAPIMSELQRLELGYQINLTGQDLADLTAFSRDEAVQGTFTIEDVPEDLRDWFLTEIDMEEDLADKFIGEEVYDFEQGR
ncbi:c-type cytochrome [Parvularcula marina]|uniref:Cytochrome c domain-containing protein n=1 Tax=Parvularcula marina TaxID=2292771 RepID=A0A371RI23_9PROT|nr:c-type cytochrome [Parvularcula marina]RFB05090.1 hypothetical protein DX908_07175 [Parvularcula marina]